LIDIATDPHVEELVAKFGGKISMTRDFVKQAQQRGRTPEEEAVRRAMHVVAFVCADLNALPVSAKTIVEKREEIERARAAAVVRPPSRARAAFLQSLDGLESILAPLDDPIVERRQPQLRKEPVADSDYPLTDHIYARARAIRARVRDEFRFMFGEAGDAVADAFVTAATGIPFGRDDKRGRPRTK
jgi:hypothetical protein